MEATLAAKLKLAVLAAGAAARLPAPRTRRRALCQLDPIAADAVGLQTTAETEAVGAAAAAAAAGGAGFDEAGLSPTSTPATAEPSGVSELSEPAHSNCQLDESWGDLPPSAAAHSHLLNLERPAKRQRYTVEKPSGRGAQHVLGHAATAACSHDAQLMPEPVDAYGELQETQPTQGSDDDFLMSDSEDDMDEQVRGDEMLAFGIAEQQHTSRQQQQQVGFTGPQHPRQQQHRVLASSTESGDRGQQHHSETRGPSAGGWHSRGEHASTAIPRSSSVVAAAASSKPCCWRACTKEGDDSYYKQQHQQEPSTLGTQHEASQASEAKQTINAGCGQQHQQEKMDEAPWHLTGCHGRQLQAAPVAACTAAAAARFDCAKGPGQGLFAGPVVSGSGGSGCPLSGSVAANLF